MILVCRTYIGQCSIIRIINKQHRIVHSAARKELSTNSKGHCGAHRTRDNPMWYIVILLVDSSINKMFLIITCYQT